MAELKEGGDVKCGCVVEVILCRAYSGDTSRKNGAAISAPTPPL